MLIDFYNATAASKKFEIVYVSSDKTVEDFEAYYSKMPWTAIPFVSGSASVKSRLSQVMGIKGIPTLVIIDAKSGMLLTANGREDVTKVMSAGKGKNATTNAAKDVVDEWMKMPRKNLSEASSVDDRPFLIKFLMFFAKNPMYLFGLFYMYKQLNRKMIEWGYGGPQDLPDMDEDDVGTGDAGAGDASEF
mmetsp:Transcript_24980/g.59380  ORF Transcript_24980/g.59380 Transcript_24980/m.59380 type:complete len:190 (-) Transcript_24980:1704-2273(-)